MLSDKKKRIKKTSSGGGFDPNKNKRKSLDPSGEKSYRSKRYRDLYGKNMSEPRITSKNDGSRIARKQIQGDMRTKSGYKRGLFNGAAVKELLCCLLVAIALFIVSESFLRESLPAVLYFFMDFPRAAIMNVFIFFLFLGPSFLFKRKKAWYVLVSVLTILISIADYIVNTSRGMPLSFGDFFNIKEGLLIANLYISKLEFVGIGLVILVLIAILLISFIKDKNTVRLTGLLNPIVWVLILALTCLSSTLYKKNPIFDRIAWDQRISYERNGFIYSFVDSGLQFIRHKPDGYSREAIDKIKREIAIRASMDKRRIVPPSERPDIIFVQLEAFMDPTRIKGVKFSEDPIPYFRKLKRENTSGLMRVPTTGGGTARTEFEILSGSSFEFLVQGEIPYVTFAANKGIPTEATHYANLGYNTIAIHNHAGNYYNRSGALGNLGFKDFTPSEYMVGLEYNETNWEKDDILEKYIPMALDTQFPGKNPKDPNNFVFAVSVQGHSKYPTNKMDIDYKIKVSGLKDETDKNQMDYYVKQIHEMDKVVRTLCGYINGRKKKTIIVFYGDHLPALNVIQENRVKMDKYESDFAMFANFRLPKENLGKDFSSYMMGSVINRYAGVPYSPMDRVHAYLRGDKDYKEKLEMVQYDINFGEQYYLKPDQKQKKAKVRLGMEPIKITNVIFRDKYIIINGENLTLASKVFVNDKPVDTRYFGKCELQIHRDSLDKGQINRIFVGLVGKNDAIIGRTNTLYVDGK